LAQTALAIELLLVAPMRIKNLASIDLTQHLVRPGRARGVVLLSFVRAEVKNDQVLDYPLPPSSIALLDRYLADYRPLLAPPGSTALFPGRDGLAKGRMVMGPRISRTIFKYTGLKMHPHLFRHFAAKLQLEAEPGSYEVMRRVLGHTSIATTTRAYAGTESAAAVRHYDKVVERLRDRPGLAPATKRRLAA
jgi:integrase